MKNNEEMTLEEVKKEISKFERETFDDQKPYVFVSYAHRDIEIVLEYVTKWIRDGYNIAIDLDFENHSSDTSWIDIMEKRLRSNNCRKVICFRSSHYYYSYASLIELLLLRSEHIQKRRNKEFEIDIYMIEEPKRYDENEEFKKEYIDKYKKMKERVGNAGFFDKNEKEKIELKYGLESLCKKEQSKGSTAEECIQIIEECFTDSDVDYYDCIYGYFDLWFKVNNMNGNYKPIEYDEEQSFTTLSIYKHQSSINHSIVKIKKEDVSKDISTNIIEQKDNDNKIKYIIKKGKLKEYNDRKFGRGRLILNVLQEIQNQVKSENFDEFNKELDDVLIERIFGGRPIIIKKTETGKYEGRYYINDHEIIKLGDEDWCVNSQDWASGPHYKKFDEVFNKIIKIAEDKFGLEIEVVKVVKSNKN